MSDSKLTLPLRPFTRVDYDLTGAITILQTYTNDEEATTISLDCSDAERLIEFLKTAVRECQEKGWA